MALAEVVTQLRKKALAQRRQPVPDAYQGVSKARITEVLTAIERYTPDQCDAVFALLDDVSPSFYSLQYKNFPAGIKFCEGATVAHVGCHFGILQRGEGKSDREGRDYWLKPLWEIGAIEKAFFDKARQEFIPGHPVAKSPFTAYRLADSFKAILMAPEDKWRSQLKKWIKEEAIRGRLALQAELAEVSRSQVDTQHSDLIRAACQYYVPHFLPGYKVIYTDETDGDRVSEPERQNLFEAGVSLGLKDSMPDVLLWNRKTVRLWVIEAVISDGEVDHQ